MLNESVVPPSIAALTVVVSMVESIDSPSLKVRMSEIRTSCPVSFMPADESVAVSRLKSLVSTSPPPPLPPLTVAPLIRTSLPPPTVTSATSS